MKRLKTGMIAIAAMLVATSAHAASGVMDFGGFTITYESSGLWEQASKVEEYNNTWQNWSYNAPSSAVPAPGGVQTSWGLATFGTDAALELQSANGQGNATLDSVFSYNIQAKPGWQLSSANVMQGQNGAILGFKGGVATVSGSGSGGIIGGDPSSAANYFSTYGYQFASSPSVTSGSWSSWTYQRATGNDYTTNSQYFYDSTYGYMNGYAFSFVISNDVAPLTALTGNTNLSMSVSTGAAPQLAYIDGTAGGAFSVNVSAIRAISPVPEPDSYAMVAASLGLIGFVARRKSKKSA